MDLPYISLDDTLVQKRKPMIGDQIILFNPHSVEFINGDEVEFSIPVKSDTLFNIEGNIIEEGLVDRNFIMVSSLNVSTTTKTTQLKTHINNVKQIIGANALGEVLEGDMKQFLLEILLLIYFPVKSSRDIFWMTCASNKILN